MQNEVCQAARAAPAARNFRLGLQLSGRLFSRIPVFIYHLGLATFVVTGTFQTPPSPLVFVLGWILCGYSMSIEHIYIRCQGSREI